MSTTKDVKHPVITRLGEILSDSDGLLYLVKLNVLFFITAMPVLPFVTVFTLGGSLTAISGCVSELVKTGNLPEAVKKYTYLFKKHFRESMFSGAVIYLLTVLFSGGFFIYLSMSGQNILFVPLTSLSLLGLIGVWSVSTHLFPAFIGYSLPDKKELVKYAAAQAVNNFKKTIFSVVTGIVIIAGMILFFPASVPLILTCAFSVPAFAGGFAHTEPEFII